MTNVLGGVLVHTCARGGGELGMLMYWAGGAYHPVLGGVLMHTCARGGWGNV